MRLSLVLVVVMFLSMSSWGISLLDGTAGARPLSFGGAYVSVGGDNESIFWNPAGIPNVEWGSLSVGYQSRFLQLNYVELYGSFRIPVKGISLLDGYGGVGLVYWSTEEEAWNDINENYGKVGASEYLIGLGYKKTFSDALSFGTVVKFSGQNVDDVSDFFFLVDVGAISTIEGIGIGLAIKNIGIGSGDNILPVGISLGAKYTVFATADNQHSVLVSGELDSVQGSGFSFKVGGEYKFTPTFWDGIVRIRLGYDTSPSKALGVLSGLGFGLDVSWYGATLAYTLFNYGFLGASHIVQLSYNFDFIGSQVKVINDTEKPVGILSVNSKLITPDGDGKNDSIAFTLKANDNVGIKWWSLELFDSGGNKVNSWSVTNAGVVTSVSKSIDWDGQGFGNTKLYDDIYTAKLTVQDLAGNQVEQLVRGLVFNLDPRNIVFVLNKEIVVSQDDKLEISLLREQQGLVYYRVVIKDLQENIIAEFKNSVKGQKGKTIQFSKIQVDFKKVNFVRGIYRIEGEFEFSGGVKKNAFPAEFEVNF